MSSEQGDQASPVFQARYLLRQNINTFFNQIGISSSALKKRGADFEVELRCNSDDSNDIYPPLITDFVNKVYAGRQVALIIARISLNWITLQVGATDVDRPEMIKSWEVDPLTQELVAIVDPTREAEVHDYYHESARWREGLILPYSRRVSRTPIIIPNKSLAVSRTILLELDQDPMKYSVLGNLASAWFQTVGYSIPSRLGAVIEGILNPQVVVEISQVIPDSERTLGELEKPMELRDLDGFNKIPWKQVALYRKRYPEDSAY